MSRCVCAGCDNIFGDERARREVKRFSDEGLPTTTNILTNELAERGVHGKSLLDIGGGIGMISLTLFEKGLTSVVNVEPSRAYVAVAKEQAGQKGIANKASFHEADFVEAANQIEPADIVTLDKVVCCYHDMESLVSLSAEKAKELYALIYPQDTWLVKFLVGLGNVTQRLRKLPIYWVHPTVEVEKIIYDKGFKKVFSATKNRWQIVIFKRSE